MVHVMLQRLDPVESFGFVKGVANNFPNLSIVYKIGKMCVGHASYHFFLDSGVIDGRILGTWQTFTSVQTMYARGVLAAPNVLSRYESIFSIWSQIRSICWRTGIASGIL